jgi:hypothetical protein
VVRLRRFCHCDELLEEQNQHQLLKITMLVLQEAFPAF